MGFEMTEVIAEIGWNHMGDMELAERMIFEASRNGASYAKFQTWSISRLKSGPWDDDGRREIYKNAELSLDDHYSLINVCKSAGIDFLSSVFSIVDVELLVELGCLKVKIPSFEACNLELVSLCLQRFEFVFISTGTMDVNELIKLRDVIVQHKEKVCILHCVSCYPCPIDKINLPRISHLRSLGFDCVGFSDHTNSMFASIASLKYDPYVIEKHFTIDPSLPGRDNKFAALPSDLRLLTEYIHARPNLFIDHGLSYQLEEQESRNIYRGRFNG